MSALLNGRSQAKALPPTSQVRLPGRSPSVTSGSSEAIRATSSSVAMGVYRTALAEAGLGAVEAGGEGVAGGAVQVPGELHRAAGLVVSDPLHGQQGRAAGLVQRA